MRNANKERLVQAFTELAPNYDSVVDQELRTFWGWRYDDFLNRMLERTQFTENDLVLDLATGTAAIPLKLTQDGYPRCRVVGLDITLAMLSVAREKGVNNNSSVSLTCASAVDIPFSAGAFDVVTCALASHHIVAVDLLSEIRRVLKTGGLVTIADVGVSRVFRNPAIGKFLRVLTFFYFLSRGYARARSEADAITNVRTIEEWKLLLENEGFRDVSIEKLPSRFGWIPAPFLITAQAR